MRADIHDGPEHNTLQPEAGYIDARPQLPNRRKPLATRGRTIHWVRLGRSRDEHNGSAYAQPADVAAGLREGPSRANCGLAQCIQPWLLLACAGLISGSA